MSLLYCKTKRLRGGEAVSYTHLDVYKRQRLVTGGRRGSMGKKSREKGARGERELTGVLRGHGYDCRRGQQFCGANGDARCV